MRNCWVNAYCLTVDKTIAEEEAGSTINIAESLLELKAIIS